MLTVFTCLSASLEYRSSFFCFVFFFTFNRGYEGVVTFLPAQDGENSPQDKTRCRSGCNVCKDVCDTGLQRTSQQLTTGYEVTLFSYIDK